MGDRVLDELLGFLGDAIFQIPVKTFMDENCLIFDPSIEVDKEHEAVHTKYKLLIDTLLEGFCKDAKMSIDKVIKEINKMSKIPDLREVFQVLFEQVLSATDFNVFTKVMTKRNILIQEQVLVMIIAATGGLPESLSNAAGKPKSKGQMQGTDDKDEEEVLRQVMQKSQIEQEKATATKRQEEEQLKKTIELSKQEAKALEEERKQLEIGVKKMVIESEVSATGGLPPPAVYASSRPQEPVKPKASVSKAPGVSPTPKATTTKTSLSSSQAANQWLQSAQAEASTQSQAHSAMAASLAKLSPEELKQRQRYLQEQRDKLLAMKKETREKQLGVATTAQPERPQSARAARNMMSKDLQASKAEDEKKLAMRRAIADKLKQEVIANPK